VLDPAELTFDFPASTRFVDAETGREMLIDPARARADYTQRLEAHLATVQDICQRLGISYARLTTSQPLELALLDFLKLRAGRGKLVSRRNGARA
jgi:uncharacterized protein (DUF58 family)